MKKFTINCDFGGQVAPFTIYIGEPEQNHHPLHFQADWLSKQRGGSIPAEVMDAVAKLKDLAEKNNVSLEELCVYAIGSAEDQEAVSSTEPAIAEEESEVTISQTEEMSPQPEPEYGEEYEVGEEQDEAKAGAEEELTSEMHEETRPELEQRDQGKGTTENADNTSEQPKP